MSGVSHQGGGILDGLGLIQHHPPPVNLEQRPCNFLFALATWTYQKYFQGQKGNTAACPLMVAAEEMSYRSGWHEQDTSVFHVGLLRNHLSRY